MSDALGVMWVVWLVSSLKFYAKRPQGLLIGGSPAALRGCVPLDEGAGQSLKGFPHAGAALFKITP